jgi:hypothetical protein
VAGMKSAARGGFLVAALEQTRHSAVHAPESILHTASPAWGESVVARGEDLGGAQILERRISANGHSGTCARQVVPDAACGPFGAPGSRSMG